MEVVGSAGTVTSAPHHTPVIRSRSGIAQEVESDWLERFADAYLLEAQAWISSVREGGPEGPTAWDGYATLAAAEAGVAAITDGTQRIGLGERPG